MKYEDPIAQNADRPTRYIFWSDLKMPHEASSWRECPFCHDGALSLRRDFVGGFLLPFDTCMGCEQDVWYVDVDAPGGTLPVLDERNGVR